MGVQFFKLFLKFCTCTHTCVRVCVGVSVGVSVCGVSVEAKAVRVPVKLELQVVVRHGCWELNSGSSARSAHTLTRWAIPPVLEVNFKYSMGTQKANSEDRGKWSWGLDCKNWDWKTAPAWGTRTQVGKQTLSKKFYLGLSNLKVWHLNHRWGSKATRS